MHKIIVLFSSVIFLLTGSILSAAQTGTFISVDEIEISEEFKLPAGSTVEFLGVIDVLTTVAKSGKLATFQYNGSIYNADASLFEELNEDENFYLLSPRTQSSKFQQETSQCPLPKHLKLLESKNKLLWSK